jgi:sugar/nucleoside kinase (ribokinase family)
VRSRGSPARRSSRRCASWTCTTASAATTASGFFYGLLSGETPEDALKLGWAHGALLTTFPGDTTMATADQVRALAAGGSARIQR